MTIEKVKTGDEPAFPVVRVSSEQYSGMIKRELIAMHMTAACMSSDMMCHIAVKTSKDDPLGEVARMGVHMTNLLLEELSK